MSSMCFFMLHVVGMCEVHVEFIQTAFKHAIIWLANGGKNAVECFKLLCIYFSTKSDDLIECFVSGVARTYFFLTFYDIRYTAIL